MINILASLIILTSCSSKQNIRFQTKENETAFSLNAQQITQLESMVSSQENIDNLRQAVFGDVTRMFQIYEGDSNQHSGKTLLNEDIGSTELLAVKAILNDGNALSKDTRTIGDIRTEVLTAALTNNINNINNSINQLKLAIDTTANFFISRVFENQGSLEDNDLEIDTFDGADSEYFNKVKQYKLALGTEGGLKSIIDEINFHFNEQAAE